MIEARHAESIHEIFSRRTAPPSPAAFLKTGTSVLIYGAGNCGRDARNVLSHHGITIEGFLDKVVSPGTLIQGIPVSHPENNGIERERRRQVCVVIAIFNRETDIGSIRNNLRSYGYENIVTFVEFHRHFPGELGNRFWLTAMSFYDSLEQIIGDGLRVWHDDKSRSLYQAILRFRMGADYACLPPPEARKIYFDDELPRWKTPMRFVDCGSFNGDTLRELRTAYGAVQSIAAFEPDPINFVNLSLLVRSGSEFAKNTALYPCGIWSTTTQMSFSSGQGESSSLSAGGEHRVQCVSLDEALPGFEPTFIKMDIEGAEYEALLGAQKMIATCRPGLAISVYHRPEHLWQIALLVKQWDLGYRFYLRAYGHAGFDVVLYAVPQ